MWSESTIKHLVRGLKAKWDPHWHLLVPEIRSAIVDAQVLSVVAGQDKEKVAAIDALRAAMHEGMGTKGV